MKQKTVLITGATGLLGKQVLIKLLAQGFRIYAVKRANSVLSISSEKIHWIEIDSFQENIFQRITEKIDFVIHAAALVSYKRSDQASIFKINTDWTAKLAADAKEAEVKKFIFLSSISALGKISPNNSIDENTPKSDKEFLTNYGKSKRQAEDLLWKLSEKGLPIIIFNPSVIIGPAKRYQSSATLFAYVSDKKPFYTKGLINYIDVRDVAEIITNSLEHKIQNEQYILSAGSTSYRNFFRRIAQRLNVEAPHIRVHKSLVILGALLENISSIIARKPATLTMETAKMAGNKNIYVAAKAQDTFSISYKSLNQSIEYTVKEMKKIGEL